ncbi:MAG: hypothetical protein AABY22_08270 [Nanoarchaeota archaeon]
MSDKVYCKFCKKKVDLARSNWPLWRIIAYSPLLYNMYKRMDKCSICGKKIV